MAERVTGGPNRATLRSIDGGRVSEMVPGWRKYKKPSNSGLQPGLASTALGAELERRAEERAAITNERVLSKVIAQLESESRGSYTRLGVAATQLYIAYTMVHNLSADFKGDISSFLAARRHVNKTRVTPPHPNYERSHVERSNALVQAASLYFLAGAVEYDVQDPKGGLAAFTEKYPSKLWRDQAGRERYLDEPIESMLDLLESKWTCDGGRLTRFEAPDVLEQAGDMIMASAEINIDTDPIARGIRSGIKLTDDELKRLVTIGKPDTGPIYPSANPPVA